MIRRLIREFYLLARGEQRAMVLLSALLILGIATRLVLQCIPGRDPPGWDHFFHESERIMTAIAAAERRSDHPGTTGERRSEYPVYDQDEIGNPGINNRSHEVQKKGGEIPSGRGIPGNRKPQGIAAGRVTRSFAAIDINRADSADLIPLPGIGPVFAGRIIRYRELLGGFTDVTQLHEVYGLPAETIDRIGDQLIFDTLALRRISLNAASFSDLLSHPYLDFGEVKALIRYRDYRCGFSSLEEIRENGLLTDSTLEKIFPYLDTGR